MKDCNQCGKCCTYYGDGGLSASASEIDRWEDHRPDIFRYVKDGNIWVHPDTGEPLTSCPWLEQLPGRKKFGCRIYADRPDDCRYYPVEIEQMLRVECEMLEPQDLENSKRAQKKLDELMADSRPPAGS